MYCRNEISETKVAAAGTQKRSSWVNSELREDILWVLIGG